jgi:4-amino-4-deoxy-L-arabinose transferase-like glycosyltransferase
MRFTSLIVELIRARPRLISWIVVLLQAALWLIVPLTLYRSPPGDVATVLAYGREYQVGTDLGPPLAFWLGDIAYRMAGNHIFGVYLLAQLCFIATFQALYLLARAIVGGQQAVIAILLTLTVTAFSSPGVEFGPLVLARPLWAILLWHSWQVIGQGRRNAWFALSIEAGLLLLTTASAIWLLLLPIGFALATKRGRRTLMSFDPLFALLVIAVLVLPYLVWLIRADVSVLPPLPTLDDVGGKVLHWAELLGGLLLAMLGIVALTALNWRGLTRKPEDAPIIFRPPVDLLARHFVYFMACAPALLGSVFAALYGLDGAVGGAGIALLMSGLAAVVATGDLVLLRRQQLLRKVWAFAIVAPALWAFAMTLILPWFGLGEEQTSLPASEIARFFGESFERRTRSPLQAVAGDTPLAALITLGATRPHLLLKATPERTPWLTPAKFNELGGVVVWRAADTVGTPPDAIVKQFPGLTPEVPRTFERLVVGRQSLLRVGWAIVRPRAMP